MLLSIGAYFYIRARTDRKWNFLLVFASAWVVSALSYLFLISGVSSGVWYITLMRIVAYVLFVVMLVSAVLELAKPKERSD